MWGMRAVSFLSPYGFAALGFSRCFPGYSFTQAVTCCHVRRSVGPVFALCSLELATISAACKSSVWQSLS